MKYKYKISVVIPIYDVEKYLDDTIESVIKQTIGFEENIQLILVNDGSEDKSDEICYKYKELYPNNVICIKQKNQGVSVARNNGMKYIKGKYVNFIDSDDIWDTDAFEKAYNMLEKHKEIDVVSFRVKKFEASNNYHPLDYKFTKDRIIDIQKDYEAIQLQTATSVIRSSAINGIKFEKKLKYSEDARFINEIILKKGCYGIISSSLYHYRKRYSSNSAMQIKNKSKTWYNDTPILSYQYIYNCCKKKYNKVIDYIQYFILYEYAWRFEEDDYSVLNNEEKEAYFKLSKELLSSLNYEVVINHRFLKDEYKKYILECKYKDKYSNYLTYDDGVYFFNGMKYYSINNDNVLVINNFKLRNNELSLLGQINSLLDKYKIIISVDDKEKEIKLFDINKNNQFILGKKIHSNKGFKESIKFKEGTRIKFYIVKDDLKKELIPSFTTQAKLNSKLPTHFIYNKLSISCLKGTIRFDKYSFISHFISENKLLFKMLKMGKYPQAIYRMIYYIYKLFNRKDIWLISDRPGVANDNGMHLFKYVKEQDLNAKVCFVLNKSSKDYKKMKKIGTVVPFGSIKYKMYFLLSKNIISSQADSWVYNAFGKNEEYYRDLYKFNYIFLQHGITKNNISSWLNAYDKDMAIFCTAAKGEQESIINHKDYMYGKDVVKLTGFARYDNLKSETIKQIAIMPTWRRYLATETTVDTGTRNYNPAFKDSEYFKFYNNLINDKRIVKCMKENGYKGIFVIHPSHVENHIDFEGNEVFEINHAFADYQKIFKESNLLISDYSSVVFDFSYMHKPIIYTQFDRETFFANHIYTEGYFNEEKDGFGPVVYNYEDTVSEIIKCIENDCKLEKKYEKRIDNFFAYTDKNNCKRIYEEIIKLEED